MKSYQILGLPALASATTHHLFVGTFSGANLYAVEFDDETLSLTLTNNITAHGSHPWINLSHDKKALYAADDPGWTSYSVDNSSSLTHTSTISTTDNCASNRGIFIHGASTPPYAVYADPFGNCANVLGVDAATGSLASIVQNVSYTNDSGVHGLALSPAGTFLYSADDSANSIWTHSIDATTGALTLVNQLAAPSDGANPRHAAVHPGGKYLYVVLEEANALAQYSLDADTGVPVYTNVTYPLIPTSGESLPSPPTNPRSTDTPRRRVQQQRQLLVRRRGRHLQRHLPLGVGAQPRRDAAGLRQRVQPDGRRGHRGAGLPDQHDDVGRVGQRRHAGAVCRRVRRADGYAGGVFADLAVRRGRGARGGGEVGFAGWRVLR